MVARVRISDVAELAAGFPVELAGFNDDAADGRSVTAQKLGCRVDDDVRAVFDRPDQVRRSEGVVDHQRQSILMRDLRNGVDVGDIAVRIAQRLQENRSGVLLNGPLYFFQIMRVHKCGFDSVLRERVLQQIEGAAVDGLLGDDVAAVCRQRLDRIGDGCCAGCQRQTCAAPFQSRHSVFQHGLRGIGQPAVDVARVSQSEPVSRMLRVMEYIGGGRVDRYCSRVRCRICLFLSYM